MLVGGEVSLDGRWCLCARVTMALFGVVLVALSCLTLWLLNGIAWKEGGEEKEESDPEAWWLLCLLPPHFLYSYISSSSHIQAL